MAAAPGGVPVTVLLSELRVVGGSGIDLAIRGDQVAQILEDGRPSAKQCASASRPPASMCAQRWSSGTEREPQRRRLVQYFSAML